MTSHGSRGFSMLELVVALAILLVVVAMSSTLFVTSARIATEGEARIQEADDARVAVNEIIQSLRLAGAGMSQGLYFSDGGAPKRIGAIYGLDGSTGAGGTGNNSTYVRPGSDDLWVVVPDRRALRESCVDIGASTLLTLGSSSGDLTVWCNGNFPVPDPNDPPNLAVVSNLTTGAIIKITGKPDATHISYSQSGVANFSDAPEKGGFLPGDLVMKAQVRHYFVNTHNGLATGVPGLFRAAADTTGAPPGTAYPQQARPFVDTDKGEMIARYVEDLQITYGYDLSSDGLGKPPLTWQVGLGPTYSPGQGGAIAGPQSLRAIKVSIVIRSAHRQTNTVGTVLDNATWAKDYAPIDCDDHILATHTPDGYSRMYYSRTVDLPNMFPGGL